LQPSTHHHIKYHYIGIVLPNITTTVDCRSALIHAEGITLHIHTCGSAAGWRSQYPAISFSVELAAS
jgi:hypothetical protein